MAGSADPSNPTLASDVECPTRRRQRPRGYAKGRAMRAQIIERAADMFGQRGFAATSLREIASGCGISHAGLLHHFPTKETLLKAVLELRDNQDMSRFRRRDNTEGIGILRTVVELADHNATVPGLIELYTMLAAEATSPSHPAHDYFVARSQRIRRGTRRALAVAERYGYVRPGVDLDALAVGLTALMDGLQVHWLLDRDSVDMGTVVRSYLNGFLTVEL